MKYYKKIKLLLLVATSFFISCSPMAEANRKANKNEKIALYPETKFDEALAKNQLAKGKSTIKGVLFAKTSIAIASGRDYGANLKIDLFPVTPYFMDWYQLRDKKENKKTAVYMSDQAYAMRLETKTDEFGRFTFSEMKPGKYFLQAFMSTTKAYNQQVPVGTGSNGYGTTTYYQTQRYLKTKNHRIEKFVEITKEGEVIEISLRN
ncbi:hypothetical protein [Flavobacterium sedimenticola]|uniref:Carboxypeptidase regulatory-like domain-containing protein n=1 Tax=Flavobacterium sedimenticola TaxID=3043286 RepID=A0ABT6XS22_9FLAO|nr:hypothetical protein [Flavobacterium sedimenticola]MDI9257891.1 hypothetical protein [Flavobacterium sedimenticola]